MLTLAEYLIGTICGRGGNVASVKALLEQREWASNILEFEPDWTEEEIDAAIEERIRKVKSGGLLVLPRCLTAEEWTARFGPPLEP